MALSRSSRTVAGHLTRYSSALGSAPRYSGEAQGPVISHGFLRNLRRHWNSDLPAPAAEEEDREDSQDNSCKSQTKDRTTQVIVLENQILQDALKWAYQASPKHLNTR